MDSNYFHPTTWIKGDLLADLSKILQLPWPVK